MSGCNVAILTDDRTVAMLLGRALGAVATETRQFASDSPTLLEDLVEFAPRLVFLRGSLVFGDAVEMLEHLGTEPALAEVQKVVLSNGGARANSFLEAGATACIAIPFTPPMVLSVVEEALRRMRKVLYVEDSRVVHLLVVSGLEEQGYKVIPAYDGEEALELLKTHKDVDLVLTDADMPRLNGYELCRTIKCDRNLWHLPVVLLTGRDDEDSIAEGFDAGADDYLTKPVVVPELLKRLERLLRGVVEPRPERILLLESNSILASVVERALGTHGFRCTVCTDAEEAREELLQSRFGLAIVDVALQGEDDGLDLISRLREEAEIQDLPVILLSGREVLQMQLRMRSAQVQAFVVKPFMPDRLLAEVERVLAESRFQRHMGEMRHYVPGEALAAIERRVSGVSLPPRPGSVRADSVLKTIFFLDIVGFTTLCEKMAPHAVVRLLNGVFDEVVPRLIGRGASIDKFIGDCVMALFPGDPASRESAVRAGIEILNLLPQLSLTAGVPVHVRIGMNTGTVVLGDIGSQHHRLDFTVVGDQVNVASRLQSAAGVDELFVSDSVLRGLPSWIVAESQGMLQVKGRSEPVHAFKIDTAVTPPDTLAPRARMSSSPPA
jgi:DNA-binding response OmpR family regulator